MKIKITMAEMHNERMLPLQKLEDMGVELIINDPTKRECNAWFVFDDYGQKDDVVAICPPENMFFSMGEAEQIKIYNRAFVQQFHHLITSQKIDYGVKNVIMDYFAGWFVGLKFGQQGLLPEFDFSYDDFLEMQPQKKTKLISVVSSNKTMCEGHRQRLTFVEKLKAHFGDELDVFGRGIRDFTDKWEVVAPYKYHIAIENQQQDYYITEKLMDPFLAFSYSIYYGAPNVADFYPQDSFTAIDIKNPQQAINMIENIISCDTYAVKLPSILAARERVLNEQNFFVKIAKLAQSYSVSSVARENVIRHECEFSWRWRLKKILHWGK